MERRLRAGQLRIVGFFDDVRVVRVPADAVDAVRRSGRRVHEPQHPGGSRACPRPLGPETGRSRAGVVAFRAEWGRDGRLRHARVDALGLGSLQELNGLPAPLREGSLRAAHSGRGLRAIRRRPGDRDQRGGPSPSPHLRAARAELGAGRAPGVARRPRSARAGGRRGRAVRSSGALLRPDHRSGLRALRDRPGRGRPGHALRHDDPESRRGAPRRRGRARARAGAARD